MREAFNLMVGARSGGLADLKHDSIETYVLGIWGNLHGAYKVAKRIVYGMIN